MSAINSLDSIVEIIRRRAFSELSNKHLSGTKSLKNNNILAKQQSVEVVKSKIIEAIKQIDKNDVNKNKKAVGVFVESVLIWSFGAELINDLAFYQLVDEVSEVILTDPSLVEQLFQMASVN